MDLLIDLPCRRLRLVLDEGSDRAALLAELRSRRGADPPRCLADPGRPCGPGLPCAFRSRRDAADRRPPASARPGRAGERPAPNGARRGGRRLMQRRQVGGRRLMQRTCCSLLLCV